MVTGRRTSDSEFVQPCLHAYTLRWKIRVEGPVISVSESAGMVVPGFSCLGSSKLVLLACCVRSRSYDTAIVIFCHFLFRSICISKKINLVF